MTRLVLVRHGESEWNVLRRVQGQSGTGLSHRGRCQSARTAEVTADAYRGALLAASDLQRCRETVEPFVDALGVEVELRHGLRERHFGDWTGVLAEDIERDDPDRWERWKAGEDVVGEVGGEDTPALVSRVTGTIRDLLERAGGRPVVCVTHGGPVWHGTQALLGLDDRVLGGVANCGVTELDVDGEHGTRLVSWNQVSHLPPDLRMGQSRGGRPTDDQEGPPVGT